MTFDVFVSYSSQDKPTADAACATLESANIRCWIAPRDIVPGRDYGESIIDAIEGAKIFILIFSDSANTSPQIKREVERAVSKSIPIIPVRIENVVPSKTLEYFISTPHWLDAFPPPREQYFAKLVESVRALLGTERGGAPSMAAVATAGAAKPPSSRRRFGWITAGVAAAALLIALVGGYFLFQSHDRQVVRVLTGHTTQADSVSFSPDGELIAGGGWDGTIRIWNAKSGQFIRALVGIDGRSSPFSPDGKLIGSGGAKDVKVWDVATGLVAFTLSGHSDKVLSVAFSPDGNSLVSGGRDKTVKIWKRGFREAVFTLTNHTDVVWWVEFSRDGRLIASGGDDGMIGQWDAATGKTIRMIAGNGGRVHATVFSPNGRWLASGMQDGTVTLWEVDNGQLLRTFSKHLGSVMSVAFSPDGGQIVSSAYDGTIKVWDTATGQNLRDLPQQTGPVYAVAYSPHGDLIASAGEDKTVKLWRAR